MYIPQSRYDLSLYTIVLETDLVLIMNGCFLLRSLFPLKIALSDHSDELC